MVFFWNSASISSATTSTTPIRYLRTQRTLCLTELASDFRTIPLLFNQSSAIENDRLLNCLKYVGPSLFPHMELLERTSAVESDVPSGIIQHLDDPKRQKNIIWIRGPSGSGKSTLILKIAAILRDRGQLGYYFDFDYCLSGTGTEESAPCGVLWVIVLPTSTQ